MINYSKNFRKEWPLAGKPLIKSSNLLERFSYPIFRAMAYYPTLLNEEALSSFEKVSRHYRNVCVTI